MILCDSLRKLGIEVERQKPILIRFEGKTFAEGYRADLVVAGQVLVEIKSVEQLARIHRKRVFTYLNCASVY